MKEQFKEILKKEGLNDWKIKYLTFDGGLCIYDLKTIEINLNVYKEQSLFLFLHEVAHAKLDKKEMHSRKFANLFMKLCVKYCLGKKRVAFFERELLDLIQNDIGKLNSKFLNHLRILKKSLGLE